MAKPRTFEQVFDRSPTTETAAADWLEDRLTRSKDGTIFSEVIELTPILAKHFLKHNAENRPLRPAKLKQFADDIVYDRWDFNGEPIIFASTGEMNDGQHRCEAVIMAGKPITTMAVYGVARDTRRTIDNGSNRTPGDHLAIEGRSYAMDLASIARFILAFERGKGKKLSETNRISSTEIVERAMADQAIEEAAVLARMAYGKFKSVAPPSVLGFCFYEFARRHKKKAEEFMRAVISGANLAPESAPYIVREKLISLDRPLREHRVELLFRGFKAYIDEQPIGRLQVRNELPSLTTRSGERKAGAARTSPATPAKAA